MLLTRETTLTLWALLVAAAAAAEQAPAKDDTGYAYVVRAVNQVMTAPCSAELRPDRAVILGGISATSLKPTEAAAQLERQIGEIRKYVSQKGGSLLLQERLRGVRAGPRDPVRPSQDLLPFVAVQRLEVELPVEADVDAVLEGLLQLGLDQYGKEVRLDAGQEARSRDATPRVVVRYRFSRLHLELEEIQRRCRTAAVEKWCEESVPFPEQRVCAQALGRIAHRFVTRSLALRSQAVPRGEGGLSPIHLSYPWPGGPTEGETLSRVHVSTPDGQAEDLEPLGNVTLRLQGSITVVLVGPRGG